MIIKLSEYIRSKYGVKARKIPIDPHIPCPHICSYCDGKGSFMPEYANKSIYEQVSIGTRNLKRKCPKCKTIIYFQSSTTTNTSLSVLRKYYTEAINASEDAIILDISTRPDAIDKDKLNLIKEIAENNNLDVFLEIGLQTMHNTTLKRINRGHTYEDYLKSLDIIEPFNFHIITHLILSLPNETHEMMTQTIATVGNDERVNGLKFHMLYILKGTKLYHEYLNSPFPMLSKEEYYNIIDTGLSKIKKNIVIHRMISSAPKEKIIAPLWL